MVQVVQSFISFKAGQLKTANLTKTEGLLATSVVLLVSSVGSLL